MNAEQYQVVEDAILNGLLTRPYNTWLTSSEQIQQIIKATPDSYIRLRRVKFSPATSGSTTFSFPPYVWSFEYVTVDKAKVERLFGLLTLSTLPDSAANKHALPESSKAPTHTEKKEKP